MFEIGEAVVYAAYGVCIVEAVETRDLTGEEVEYYVLRPVGDGRSRFYVPTSGSPLLDKLRRVCTREDADELIAGMPETELLPPQDEIQRKAEYRRIMENGSPRELVSLIRTLYLSRRELASRNKKLHSAEDRLLTEADDLLCAELSYALGIPRGEVVGYIRSRVKE
ncbi:MAG: CarD family transcriptional regulator [Ruminococcus sp.]|nr:CarD family transcriptional regulator [Ruminococcus sp.]